MSLPAVAILLALQAGRPADPAPAPLGLARTVLSHPGFTWTARSAAPFRIYFLAGTYAAAHQDSLIAELETARLHAFELLGQRPDDAQLHVFFLESRLQMETLLKRRATGFAEPGTGTVLLMTNPTWRAFQRHEVMHVVGERAWGPADAEVDWLREGLAQFADGRCGGYTNEQVASGLATVDGWVPLAGLFHDFRALPDLTAYLQAATLAGYIHRVHGVDGLRAMWQGGPPQFERQTGVSLAQLERDWRKAMASLSDRPGREELEAIRQKGCG